MTQGSLMLALRAVVETLRISAPTVVDSTLHRVRRDVCDRRLAAWSRRLVDQARIVLRVSGRENVCPGETFVLMSNHQSHYDVPVLFRAIPGTVRMIAKTELFAIPVFGAALHAAEFIEVDRRNREKSRESILIANARLRSGIHVWIAPEGTRSETGVLGPFKRGGFLLAQETGLRILPITIDGTRHVLPTRGVRVRQGRVVEVWIHSAIAPASYGNDRNALVRAVRDAIASKLPPELRGASRAGGQGSGIGPGEG